MSIEAVVWTVACVGIYFVGFIVAGVIEQRICDKTWDNHKHCRHPFAGPEPTFWPLVACFVLFIAPFVGAGAISRWLAKRETPVERRDRLAIERDERVREQARTIERLEREAGIR